MNEQESIEGISNYEIKANDEPQNLIAASGVKTLK